MFYIFLILIIEITMVGARGQSLPASQDQFIYSVYVKPKVSDETTAGNDSKASDRLQVGFKLEGQKGIVTALHGVVDAAYISAFNKSSSYRNLALTQVDFAHDVALLTSQDLESEEAVGLKSSIEALAAQRSVTIIGHPNGVAILSKRHNGMIGDPPEVKLSDVISKRSEKEFDLFKSRGSPSLDIDVVELESGATVGDSGGPVLDTGNRLIGMIIGGAGADIVWVVHVAPLRSSLWQDANSLTKELNDLAALGPQGLFSFSVPEHRVTTASALIGRWFPITSEVVRTGGARLVTRAGFLDVTLDDNGTLRASGSLRLDARSTGAIIDYLTAYTKPGFQYRMDANVNGIEVQGRSGRSLTGNIGFLDGLFTSGYLNSGRWVNDDDFTNLARVQLRQGKDGFLALSYPYHDELLLGRIAGPPLTQIPDRNGAGVVLHFSASRSQTAKIYIDDHLVGSVEMEAGEDSDFNTVVQPGRHTCRLEASYSNLAYDRGGVRIIDLNNTGFNARGNFQINGDGEFKVTWDRKDFFGHPILDFAPMN